MINFKYFKKKIDHILNSYINNVKKKILNLINYKN